MPIQQLDKIIPVHGRMIVFPIQIIQRNRSKSAPIAATIVVSESLIVKKFCHSFIFALLMNNALSRNKLKFDKKGFPRHAIYCFWR